MGLFSIFGVQAIGPEHTHGKSDKSSHMPGTKRAEEWISTHGRESGRQDNPPHRTARDSTSVHPESREPIDPRMPHIPPA
jgi:hypothetical protein